MIIVLIGLAAIVLGAVLKRMRSHRRDAAPTGPPAAVLPTFRVVALGSRGSGKTLLLASMYHQMQVPAGRSYFVTAPFDQVVLLNQWFTEVADTSRAWPAGTTVGETREFVFTVRSRAASGTVHDVMHLNYLEYAGGLLTDAQAPGSTGQADLVARIDSAHALLGIIDGYRVKQCLDGHHEGQMRLQQSLTSMINLMLLASCPISFLITKWDVLQDIDVDENARLQRVRKFLMSNQGFNDLVRAHSHHRVVRLIPVSAVGPDFAEVDDGGRIAKLPDGAMRPTNVDVPFAAVVPDVFEQVERRLDKAELQTALDRIRRQTRGGPLTALAELGTFVAQSAGKVFGPLSGPAAGFLGDAAVELLGATTDPGAERRRRADRQISEAARTIEELHLVRRRVLRDFQSRVDVLEGRLPSSRLSGED
jgi:hypothetical protein